MASEEILKSYLMSIGFKIDEAGYKKFKDNQEDSEKRIKELGAQLERFAGIAASSATVLTASVVRISDKLTQLYYASQIAGSSAKNLQAFKSAAEQVGISADAAQQAVESMAMKMRENPQLVGLLRGFNINPDQDKVQVLLDLVDKLKQLPFYQGVQIAGMFGISDTTLYMLETHRDELQKYIEQYRKLNEATDQQSAASRKFHNDLQDLENRFNKLWETISTRLLPVGEKVIAWLDQVVDALQRADKATDGWSSRLLGVASALVSVVGGMAALRGLLGFLGLGGAAAGAGGAAGGAGAAAGGAGALPPVLGTTAGVGLELYTTKKLQEAFGAKTGAALGLYNASMFGMGTPTFLFLAWVKKHFGENSPQAAQAQQMLNNLTASSGALAAKGDDLIGAYSKKYGVDPALMRALAHEEHGTDKAGNPLVSPKGAIGMFQLMPDTAKGLGVDPFNKESNIEGGIRYFAGLLAKYAGNESLALAAYNAGGTNVDKYGGIPPFKETQNYVADILSYRLAHPEGAAAGPRVVLHQQTKIDINGVTDPVKAGREVTQSQERVNGDMVRAASGVVK